MGLDREDTEFNGIGTEKTQSLMGLDSEDTEFNGIG